MRTFVIVSVRQESWLQCWQWLPAVRVPDSVFLPWLKAQVQALSLSCLASFVDRHQHQWEHYQTPEKTTVRNKARGNQAIFNPSVQAVLL